MEILLRDLHIPSLPSTRPILLTFLMSWEVKHPLRNQQSKLSTYVFLWIIVCFRTVTRTTMSLNFICLTPREYLSFLEKNTTVEWSQYYFRGFAIEETTTSPEINSVTS